MPADGFSPAPMVHADGIYIGLPLRSYLRDRALSSTALKKLISSAPACWWEHPDNPLWDEPESNARALGNVIHKVLEGEEAYEATYFVEPERSAYPNALDTANDLKAWLKDRGQKVTGVKADLIERVKACAANEDEPPIIWDEFLETHGAGRERVTAKIDRYVRLVNQYARAGWAPLFETGLSEVSIFWTEEIDGEKVRFKCRPDRLLLEPCVVDFKKYGQPPAFGADLEEHLQRESAIYRYDIQAMHNTRGAAQIPRLLADGAAFDHGEGAIDRLNTLAEIGKAIAAKPLVFTWLFLQSPGPPCGLAIDFSARDKLGNPDPYFKNAAEHRDIAIERFIQYRARFGDEMWFEQPRRVRADPAKWPTFLSRTPL
jgi:hypothetical protein